MSGINGEKMPGFPLNLRTGGDYMETVRWEGAPYPPGSELEIVVGARLGTPAGLASATIYPFSITGDSASIKVESEVCDLWAGEYRLRYRDTTSTPSTERIVCGGRIVRS